MRPDIDISHQLNGRVKDYAEQKDLPLKEAYENVIQRGISELEAEG